MRTFSVLLLFFCLLSFAFPALAEPTSVDKSKVKDEKSEQVVVTDPAPAKKTSKNDKKKPKTEEVERFVMPFTKWIEGKLHSSPVVNPTKKQISRKSKKSNQTGLRDAIKKALKIYPGTVLSADKSTQNGTREYRIKIISKSGIVKIVTVPEISAPSTKEK